MILFSYLYKSWSLCLFACLFVVAVDLCGSSANSQLCYQIEEMKTYNKNLEGKLESRDIQINQLLSDVKMLTTIFIQQKTKMDQMEIEVTT